jgi:hypothetical protein
MFLMAHEASHPSFLLPTSWRKYISTLLRSQLLFIFCKSGHCDRSLILKFVHCIQKTSYLCLKHVLLEEFLVTVTKTVPVAKELTSRGALLTISDTKEKSRSLKEGRWWTPSAL